jgi:hypothetical protein
MKLENKCLRSGLNESKFNVTEMGLKSTTLDNAHHNTLLSSLLTKPMEIRPSSLVWPAQTTTSTMLATAGNIMTTSTRLSTSMRLSIDADTNMDTTTYRLPMDKLKCTHASMSLANPLLQSAVMSSMATSLTLPSSMTTNSLLNSTIRDAISTTMARSVDRAVTDSGMSLLKRTSDTRVSTDTEGGGEGGSGVEWMSQVVLEQDDAQCDSMDVDRQAMDEQDVSASIGAQDQLSVLDECTLAKVSVFRM